MKVFPEAFKHLKKVVIRRNPLEELIPVFEMALELNPRCEFFFECKDLELLDKTEFVLAILSRPFRNFEV